ncbi:cytochrome o ubiquinol oxidase subunit IV [Labrys monachus]|uniref:Cytochrome bo(3) ubiquinol oxidase subunit 4 n=1 Tax=Labrys monachus TaxID=217067 RepID=A0ABU0FMM8_9HYPH|nr:cytochrome o ubiquinol oxidase subunit IV [Labrys monachus]MDQ0395343.1 cytochrome o ubiquinol oxidase operon protein cyoD [Labrys monachus]
MTADAAPHESGHHGHGESHGSQKSYLIGFVLSVVLTAVPFWLVMTGTLDSKLGTALAIMVLAAVQIVVHMIYFLHMNVRSEGGWTMMALIFTLVMVVITLSGSIWVMYHLNINMMPGHDMSQMP